MGANYDDYEPSYEWATPECPNTIFISVYMRDRIDGDILDKAVQTAIKRFPYFQVSLKREGENIISDFDERPIVVRKWLGGAFLGTEETNGHILIVSYKDNQIIFEITHYITDGAGFSPFVKSALYYYVSDIYGTDIKKDGFYLCDMPFFDGEMGDPYKHIDFEHIDSPIYHYKKKDALIPDDLGIDVGAGNTVYYLDVNEASFVGYAKKNGASPSVMMSQILMRTFRKLCPESKKYIVCGIGTNQKAVIGNRYNYRMASSRVYIDYPPKTRDWPEDRLATIGRGSIVLQNQPENVLEHEKLMRGLYARTKRIPSLEERVKTSGIKKYQMPVSTTFDVSYVGKVDWGEMEPYISGIYSEVNFQTGNSMLVEVNAIHGNLTLAIMQGFEDDRIVNAFRQELERLGIPNKLVLKKAMETSMMDVLRIK